MATVVCEKHGLRFDPERASGCVLCRREEGVAAPAARASGPRRTARPRSIVPAVAVTFGLWILCGLALYAAHQQVVASLRSWGAEPALEESSGYDETGYGEEEGHVPYAEPDASTDEPGDSPAY